MDRLAVPSVPSVTIGGYLPWRRIALAIYVGVNLSLTLVLVRPENTPDWELWRALGSGNPYRLDTVAPYVWSPLLVPVMQAIGALGPLWSIVGHVAAVLLLRSPLLIVLTLASWAFWTDAVAGNLFTFVFVAGVLALRGNRWGVLASFVLFLLMPRPIQLPLLLWLGWQHRELWRWFVGLFVAHALAILATGLAFDWLATMLTYGRAPEYDIGPTAWFGVAWLLIGIPLGLYLTWKGRVGLAGLTMSNYLMPQYLLVALWEVNHGRLARTDGTPPAGDRGHHHRADRGDHPSLRDRHLIPQHRP